MQFLGIDLIDLFSKKEEEVVEKKIHQNERRRFSHGTNFSARI